MAEALQAALDMPLDERKGRWAEMMDRLHTEDIESWRTAFLSALQSTPAMA